MGKIVHAHNYRWDVPTLEYKTEGTGFRAIHRQTLIGEAEDEARLNFVTRYFEIQPGGYSSLEHHEHPHSVVILRGSGEVVLHDRVEPISAQDCVYVAPHEWHQIHATGDEPLGFLCVVDRNRDRPQTPSDDELADLRENPALAARIRV